MKTHYTLGEAAKATGLSKTTIYNAIKSGRISLTSKSEAGYQIAPSELHRVFPAINGERLDLNASEQLVTPPNTQLNTEVNALRDRIEREKENIIQLLKQQIIDIQQDRDHWRQQAEKVTYLLEDKRHKTKSEHNPSWFRRLFKSDE